MQRSMMVPLLELKEYDQYTTTHAMNVSVLSMALSKSLGMSRDSVRNIGMAGLLHDLGKIRIPLDILNKPGKLIGGRACRLSRRTRSTAPVFSSAARIRSTSPRSWHTSTTS